MLAVFLAMCAQILLMFGQHSLWTVAAALLVFFTAFNVLEATLPSLISKIAPLSAKGTAMGVYSSVQFLGAFFGAVMGGVLMQNVGGNAVFIFSIILLALWLLVASTMRPPLAVSTKLFHLSALSEAQATQLQQGLQAVQGVREVFVVAAEGVACLKVDMQGYDAAAVEELVNKV
jgi:MFS family permease